MTALAAPTAIFILLDRTVFAAIVITLSIEVTGMTGSAIWRVPVELVRDVLIIVVMAGATSDNGVMIAGVVAGRGMSEVDGRPALGEVTVVTLSERHEVIV